MPDGYRPVPPVAELAAGVRRRDPAALGRAISLVESRAPADEARAASLQAELGAPRAAFRVGVSGVPGVGKSTFIDALGARLLASGRRVAVLAVDPSSTVSGGSILGDKTRMQRLAADPRAFVRPSPTTGALGGVAPRTAEAMALCESAGFDVVIVETVGVGQSETAVADLVDVFLVLMLPGGGDELQGIKRGLMERADVIAVNKADGAQAERARATARDYRAALHLMRGREPGGAPPVLTCSAQEELGLDEVWQALVDRRMMLEESGELAARRRHQQVRWLWRLVDERLRGRLADHPALRPLVAAVEAAVAAGRLPPASGAHRLLAAVELVPKPAPPSTA